MPTQKGIAIAIRAFLPTGKSLDDQFQALTMVKNAHETGDYTEVLKASQIEDVKAEQKTRRVESAPAQDQTQQQDATNDAGTAATDAQPQKAEKPGRKAA